MASTASTEVEHYQGRRRRRGAVGSVGLEPNQSTAPGTSSGVIAFGFLLAMLRGNHVGHVEDWFLIVFAALALFVLVRDLWGRRRGWIR